VTSFNFKLIPSKEVIENEDNSNTGCVENKHKNNNFEKDIQTIFGFRQGCAQKHAVAAPQSNGLAPSLAAPPGLASTHIGSMHKCLNLACAWHGRSLTRTHNVCFSFTCHPTKNASFVLFVLRLC
jgi:hypothetical protein